MAWTTRVIDVDHETGEILTTKRLHEYRLYKKETIIRKIHETHTERTIIKLYRRSDQRQLFETTN